MDPIKKAMYLGLGAISLTKEKAEKLIDELVQRGEVNGKERTAMVEKLMTEGAAQRRELEANVAASAQKVITDLGLPTQKDFQNLSKRLDGIEKAMTAKKKDKQGTKA